MHIVPSKAPHIEQPVVNVIVKQQLYKIQQIFQAIKGTYKFVQLFN